MKAAVCMLLLSGLLASLADGYSVKTLPFLVDDSTEEGVLWSSNDDPDWRPSDSQEDFSDEDDNYSHENFYDSREDPYSQEDLYSREEPYSREDPYSQEEPYSLEDPHSQEDIYDSREYHPFPDVTVPKAEYVTGGGLQQQLRPYQYVKRKRDVQQVYQTQGQVVQVPYPYQNKPYRPPRVNVGVEPLLPVEGPPQHEIAVGVKPEVARGDGSAIGNWWRRFSGRVENTFEHIGDKIEDIGEALHETFHGLKEKVAHVVVRFKALMVKFGILIQEGIRYCIRRLEHSYDQGKQLLVIEKLERKLQEGHAEVVKFFQILGEKINTWREQHRSENIDVGLIDVHGPGGQNQQTSGQHNQDIEQQMPNFYQDTQVLSQLDKLREEGVLTQNEIIILTEDQIQQQPQSQQNYDQQRQTPVKPEEPKFIEFPESER
ncbi:uncharacterized protein LOC135109554 isoform X1 [Scylla paramamosain]|uniref:uncharacterized protein LOC135109554 isoform X1 n=1 Tax=Scylla paramamosain TaxID=85552 RepID=UPI0030834190